MSVYFKKGKGWRYDFTLKGTRYTMAWFKTKREAQMAEAKRKEVRSTQSPEMEIRTDIIFTELINSRLDFMLEYKSKRYYEDMRYLARRIVKNWGNLPCDQITDDIIQRYILNRARVSHNCANYDLRLLRSMFNFGMKRGFLKKNPTSAIEFLPVEKKMKYIPPKEDVWRVILSADPDAQDYLWTIALTLGRVGEINRLTWSDVDFNERSVILHTRKKKGGHLSPRKVPMSDKLYDLLHRRYLKRETDKPWVFWHRYWDREKKQWAEGPFKDRKRIMKSFCERAGVRYFRFHAIRHFGASIMDQANVRIGDIQRILGHEKRSTTDIYLHSIGESERSAVRVLEQEMLNVLHQISHTESHTEKKISDGNNVTT